MIATIVWALVVGVVLGYLGKLLLPGRQNIPWWATIGAGVVAALLAGLVADGWVRRHTAGIDWLYPRTSGHLRGARDLGGRPLFTPPSGTTRY